MKIMLDKIIEECNNNNIKVAVENRNGEQAYRVDGFSKSGNALLYIEDDTVICETRYGQKDHVLTFRDLVLVAKSWYEMCKHKSPFENPEPEWVPVFDSIHKNLPQNRANGLVSDLTAEDFPF